MLMVILSAINITFKYTYALLIIFYLWAMNSISEFELWNSKVIFIWSDWFISRAKVHQNTDLKK